MVYADASVSITKLKKNPSAIIEQAEGFRSRSSITTNLVYKIAVKRV
jgi:hypothetical protein